MNDIQGSLKIIHPITFLVIFVTNAKLLINRRKGGIISNPKKIKSRFPLHIKKNLNQRKKKESKPFKESLGNIVGW
jgi:hypothetical protein